MVTIWIPNWLPIGRNYAIKSLVVTIWLPSEMTDTPVSPKSIDPRDRPVPVRLDLIVELFYAFQGRFVRNASKSRAMEQFLADRAGSAQNIADLRSRIIFNAGVLDMTPLALIEKTLEEEGYGTFLKVDAVATALCTAWEIPTGEMPPARDSEK